MSGHRSAWRLRVDLISARLLLALSLAESRGELHPGVHRFLADRYAALAAHWRRRGWPGRAATLAGRAAAHAEAAGADDPPPAAAMGLPRRWRTSSVDARGRVVAGPWSRSRRPRSHSPA